MFFGELVYDNYDSLYSLFVKISINEQVQAVSFRV